MGINISIASDQSEYFKTQIHQVSESNWPSAIIPLNNPQASILVVHCGPPSPGSPFQRHLSRASPRGGLASAGRTSRQHTKCMTPDAPQVALVCPGEQHSLNTSHSQLTNILSPTHSAPFRSITHTRAITLYPSSHRATHYRPPWYPPSPAWETNSTGYDDTLVTA